MKTDCEYLLELLDDEKPHSLNEILRRSFFDRGCGMTVHSRAADLRKQGYDVVNEQVHGAKRGDASVYRLVKPSVPDRAPMPPSLRPAEPVEQLALIPAPPSRNG